jgi:hypothetical protein
MRQSLMLAAVLALAAACASTEKSDTKPNVGESKAAFERITGLAGDWSGHGSEGTEMATVDVRYRVTAAGSAVEETLFPGTTHEMVTMYYLDNGALKLTHFCSAGNQPTMLAVPQGSQNMDVAKVKFIFDHGTNMPNSKVGHMHSAELDFQGNDHLVSKWAYWNDGKLDHEATFQLERKTTG